MADFPYYSPREIKNLFNLEGFSIRKKWGQNFLIDPNLSVKIARLVTQINPERILEIGPGLGVLSNNYMSGGAELTAVELDPFLFKIVGEQFKNKSNFHPIHGDARDYLEENTASFDVVTGNLPYYITSDLLILCVRVPGVKRGVFLVQKEYAERIIRSDAASSINVYLNNFGSWKEEFRLGPDCFYPKPSIDSSVISFHPYSSPLCSPELLESLLRMTFRGKRKKIRNAWKMKGGLLEFDTLVLAAEMSGLDLEMRPEAIPRSLYYSTVQKLMELTSP